jgi:nitrite reductase (NADH) small subunit
VSTRLFPLSELPAGSIKRALVGRTAVVIIRTKSGDLHALRDACPHLGAALSNGVVQQMSVATMPGQQALSETIVVRCPWHGYEFAVTSGVCPADPGLRIRSYKVEVDDEWVVIDR